MGLHALLAAVTAADIPSLELSRAERDVFEAYAPRVPQGKVVVCYRCGKGGGTLINENGDKQSKVHQRPCGGGKPFTLNQPKGGTMHEEATGSEFEQFKSDVRASGLRHADQAKFIEQPATLVWIDGDYEVEGRPAPLGGIVPNDGSADAVKQHIESVGLTAHLTDYDAKVALFGDASSDEVLLVMRFRRLTPG